MNGTSVSNGIRLSPINIKPINEVSGIFRNLLVNGKRPWCHCDFRKMEALKVNKFGRTYRTGIQAVQARCEEL